MDSRAHRLLLLLALLTPLGASAAPKGPPSAQQSAFGRLATLVGDWRIHDSDKDFHISFELIANDSVLVETWHSTGAKRSLTLYHLDRDRLMATHYCPQGNQPRLILQPRAATDEIGRTGPISFRYLDATNLGDAAESHQHSLSFDLNDPTGRLRRTESYLQNGEEESSTLVLVRREAVRREAVRSKAESDDAAFP
jgi:hypothetical protein